MNENSIITCTICLNEIEILPYTLLQSLKYSDKVIVINGGAKLSTDGTTEYLNELQKEYGDKLIVKHGIFGDNTLENNWDRVQRMEYIKILNEIEFDGFSFLNDADETMTDDDWLKMIDYIKYCNKNDIIMCRFPYYYFFKDVNHLITGKDWNVFNHHLCKFEPHNRQYLDNSTLLRDLSGRCLTHYPSNMILEVEDIHIFHYSHNANYEKQKYKMWRYRVRQDLGPIVAKNTPSKYEDFVWEDTRESEMSESKVKSFTGQHPSHMKGYLDKYASKNH